MTADYIHRIDRYLQWAIVLSWLICAVLAWIMWAYANTLHVLWILPSQMLVFYLPLLTAILFGTSHALNSRHADIQRDMEKWWVFGLSATIGFGGACALIDHTEGVITAAIVLQLLGLTPYSFGWVLPTVFIGGAWWITTRSFTCYLQIPLAASAWTLAWITPTIFTGYF